MRFFILLFLISCGIQQPAPINYDNRQKIKLSIETEELKLYVDMFERDSALYGDGIVIRDLVVRFGDVDTPNDNSVTLGKCYRSINRTPEIIIDSNHWKDLSDVNRMILMYHELGHCVLNRSHVEKDYKLSIMNPFITSGDRYNSDEDHYLTELFDTNKKNDWLLLTFIEEIY